MRALIVREEPVAQQAAGAGTRVRVSSPRRCWRHGGQKFAHCDVASSLRAHHPSAWLAVAVRRHGASSTGSASMTLPDSKYSAAEPSLALNLNEREGGGSVHGPGPSRTPATEPVEGAGLPVFHETYNVAMRSGGSISAGSSRRAG